MVNFQFPMVEITVPYISSPKIKSVDLFYYSRLIFNFVQNLVIWNLGVHKFGPVSLQDAEKTFHKENVIFLWPNVL